MVVDTRSEAVLFWGGLTLLGTAYELWAIRNENGDRTLSHFTRAVFHTNTKAGRVAFTLAWGGLGAWFANHILTEGIPHE